MSEIAPWVGINRAGWARRRIWSLGRTASGSGFPPALQGQTGLDLPFYKVKHLGQASREGILGNSDNSISFETAKQLGATVFPAGTLVYAKVGAALMLGRVRTLPVDACIDNNMAGLTPSEEIESRFLFWAMSQVKFDYLVNPGAVPSLSDRNLLNFPLLVPPLEEQRAITNYLDRETARIDMLIEEQRRLIELLRERRAATVADALDGHERTQVRRLVDHNRPMTYGILQCGEPVDGGVAYIGPSDIQGEGRSPKKDALRTTAPEIASAYKRSTLKGGDVVVSIGPAYGKVAVVSADLDGANLTQDTVRVALRPDLVMTRFFVWALLSRQTAEYWDYQIMGATFRRLNLGTLARTPIPLPAIHEQRKIAAYLDEQTTKIDLLIAEAQRFIELSTERRSALVAAAVAGQIDVREVA
ncbi:restriction endonuclease subunit S [Streptomyces sp. NPDC001770]